VALGGENFAVNAEYNGKPASAFGIKLSAGANALDTANAVRTTLARLQPYFPHGLQVVYPYDTTPFVKISIKEVVKTLIEAIGLVFLVMYLFLQNLRATLIPTIAVPVVLAGTFAVLAAVGYSINVLTMFGMVLAIGLLVDDAIVVVENVERVMADEGLSPKDATRKSMQQITGALVGIALVLCAVFLPMAFFGGSTGVIYRQFSITMVSAMALSVLVALIFTPALCATLLKPSAKGQERAQHGFFGWFNRIFDRGNHAYLTGVQHVVARTGRYLLIYGAIAAVLGFLLLRLPSAFLPDEDQGVLFVQVSAPAGATQERTARVLSEVRDYFLTQEKANVRSVFTVSGFSFGGRGQSAGLGFVSLKDWKERPGRGNRVQAIAGRATARFARVRDALVFAFAPPALLELGNATGFDFELEDHAGVGHDALMQARNQLLGMAAHEPNLMAVRPNGLDDEPQYKLEVDWEKASALGVSVSDINNSLTGAWGSAYVNQFVDRGRIKRVFIQGDPSSRMSPQDLDQWYVRNASGSMVPFSAFISPSWTYGSPKLERYNGLPSFEILGQPAPGQSTGTAIQTMEQLAKRLPAGIGYEWTGLSYEEQLSSGEAPVLYALSLIVVFLCLAALYESWSIPAVVMLVVPLGVVGAVLATTLRGLDNDVFFQVGLLTTVGLSAKNAILIVEFAKENFDRGLNLVEATLDAARQRLRPILMTSFAFILGVLPLAISTGAGSGGQNAIGTGVIGGMLSATVLAVFFVPMFFVAVLRWLRVRPQSADDEAPAARLPLPQGES
jgi:multidrug efflux pump